MNRNPRIGLTASLVICALGACSSGGPDSGNGGTSPTPAGAGSISGVITGPVVANVTVQLTGPGDYVTTTDAQGNFAFTGLAPGSYFVTPLASSAAHFTPPRRTIESNDDSRSGANFVSYVPPDISGFSPPSIGSELWAWGWAGDSGANVTRVRAGGNGDEITFMADGSGRGNHFFNNTGRKAAFLDGLNLDASTLGGAYSTTRALIGVDRWGNGTDHFGSIYYQSTSMAATADFYLVCTMVNTRDAGSRELFGTDDQNTVRLDQGLGDVYITIDGVQRRVADGTVPYGPLVLEIWRDQGGVLTVQANRQNITTGSVTLGGTFDVSGFGFDQTGTSYYDDYLMEIVMCDALPTAPERDQMREYMRVKWTLY